MSLVDDKLRSPSGSAARDRSLARLLGAVNGFFPPGTPIAGAVFLDGVASAVGGDQAALVLVRMSKRHRVLRVVDDLLHKASSRLERAFSESVNNHAAWKTDPVARRLHDRCHRRPSAHFAYATHRLARKLNGRRSFSIEFLDGMGVRHEITSLLPVAGELFSLLSVYRMTSDASPFVRAERRTLKLLHRTFAPRLVDLRLSGIRGSLPNSLRATFELLLAGQTEKEIAVATHRSPNTVHDHVKRIYAHFNVASRPRLMARFIDLDRVLTALPTNGLDAPLNPDEA